MPPQTRVVVCISMNDIFLQLGFSFNILFFETYAYEGM